MKNLYFSLICGCLLGAATISARAQTGGTDGNITWSIEDGILTISGDGDMPDYSGGGAPWYPNRTSVTAVVIQDGVTAVGNYAFYDCSDLMSVTIPNSVTAIRILAFYNCTGLKTVNFNAINCANMSSGNHPFLGCSKLAEINIGDEVMTIPAYAFYGCSSLITVTIPELVTSVGNAAFSYCTGLRTVHLNAINIPPMGNVFSGCNNMTLNIGSKVTVIPDNAFNSCSALTTVIIPNSVTSIGNSAFSNTGLTSVNIPNTVTSISDNTFSRCAGLTSVTIPESVKSIGDNAFSYCSSLLSVIIPNSVKSIGTQSFYVSGLTSVTIPESVESVGNGAFSSCTGLTTVNFNAVNCASMGVSSSSAVFYYCNKLTEVNIGNKVTVIPDYAFSSCSALATVTIPESVESIGIQAFYWCPGLETVNIGNSVSFIGGSAFNGCSRLSTVTIPESVTSVGNGAFSSCTGLRTVHLNAVNIPRMSSVFTGCENITLNIGNKTTVIPDYTFYGCTGLSTVNIPNSVTYIGDNAFYGCTGLKSVNIPNTVSSIRDNTFSNCGLTSVTIPNSVTSIGNNAFAYCRSLTSVFIPESVKTIGSYAFSNCGLTSVTIPNSVTSIESYTFITCSSLAIVTIPNSVTSIGSGAFQECRNIETITIPESVTSIGSGAFLSCTGLTTVNFNAINCTNMNGTNHPFGGCFNLTEVNIGSEVMNIPVYAFYGCTGLKTVTIPESVISIGDRAFSSCTDLTTVDFNAINCTSMGRSNYLVFSGCSNLTEVNIGNKVTNIPDNAFSGCTGLTTVNIGNSVTSIGDAAFYGTGLASVNIPNSVKTVGNSAFYQCSGLTSVNIGNSVTTVGVSAFYQCAKLASITIPNSVESVGNSAFYQCTGLTTVTIGNSVTSVESYAFSGCNDITSVTCFARTPPVLGTYVFRGLNYSNCILYVPAGSQELYEKANGWKDFMNMVTATQIDAIVIEEAKILNPEITDINQKVRVRYTVRNTDDAPVNGIWTDAVYLSHSRMKTGEIKINETIEAGQTVTKEIECTLPELADGNYEVYVKIMANLPAAITGGEQKMMTCDESLTVTLPELKVGETVQFDLARNERRLYKFAAHEGFSTMITDKHGKVNMAAYPEYIPAATENIAQTSQLLLNNPVGAYYVLFRNNPLLAETNQPAEISLRNIGLEIVEVFADEIVRQQESALIRIEAIGCSGTPVIALVGKDGKQCEAEKVHLFSETMFSGQFRVNTLDAGEYGIYVSSGGKSDLKEKAVTLIDETPRADLETKIILPSVTRFGSIVTTYVEYRNAGNVDIPAPLLIMTGTEGTTYQVGDGEIYTDELHLMGLNAMGVVNILKPGEGGRIEIKLGIPDASRGEYQLRILSRHAEGMDEPFYLQWLNVEPAITPAAFTQEEWDGYTSRLRNLTGDTWESFVDALNMVEERLANRNAATVDAKRVYSYMKEMAMINDAQESQISRKDIVTTSVDEVEPGTIFIWDEKNWSWLQLVEYTGNIPKRIDVACEEYQAGRPTIFISHGMNNDRSYPASAGIALALESNYPKKYNIIGVDWGKWAKTGIDPVGSANSIPAVANRVYENLNLVTSGNIKDLHLIGHSHGAHVCGMLAKNFNPKPARLTLLDASPNGVHWTSANLHGMGWGPQSANYVDYYKSSLLYSTDDLKGKDNFILIDPDDKAGFVEPGLISKIIDIFDGTAEKNHGYAVTWYINTIYENNHNLGFNSYRNYLDEIWGNWGIYDNQWHGVIRGNKIENLHVRDKLEDVKKENWKYTRPWYTKGELRTFRDAFSGTFEFQADENKIILPERIVGGTQTDIELSYTNRADNHSIPKEFAQGMFEKNSENYLYVSTEAILDGRAFQIDKDVNFALPETTTLPYKRTVTFSKPLWEHLGGTDDTNSIECYLIYAVGMDKKHPFTPWEGDLYPENNIASKKIIIYNSDLWCDAGEDQTLKLNKGSDTRNVSFNGESETSLSGETKYSWVYKGNIISEAKSFNYDFPVGIHKISLTVSNGARSASDHLTITIKPLHPADPPPGGSPGGPGGIGDPGGSGSYAIAFSHDPNEKVGVNGAGGKDCVLPGDDMIYTVFFENDPELANAAAQEVRVIDVLDEAFDLSTFSFLGANVANTQISIPSGVVQTTTLTDLRPDNDLLLRTTLRMDIDTRTVSAVFESIDPETGEFTTDVLAGFLYPNDETHRGEGQFSYRVSLKNDLPDGYQIKNHAEIYFDFNEPIVTNETSHLIDLTPPVSSVKTLPEQTADESVKVSWDGTDEGSGIRHYDIYVSDNGGEFTLWKNKIASDEAWFAGEIGHTYRFFSVATDSIGHREAMKSTAEATIKFTEEDDPVIEVTGITLDPITLSMKVGEEEMLTVTVLPENATDKSVTWSSSDLTVASVNNGLVTALKSGTTTITVQAHNGVKAECTITVNEPVVTVTSVTLSPTMLSMTVGEEKTLTATVLPENAADKTVTWSSSAPSVATVTNGAVIALKAGTAAITVTTNDGGKTSNCEVTVSTISGVEDNETLLAAVYPNPTDGRFTIVFAEEGTCRVSIANIAGVILSNELITGVSYQIDISGYPDGVYLLTVENGKNKTTVKIVKNRKV